MNSLKVKKGDKVKVIAGKDKGKTGVILRSFPDRHRVVVEGCGMIKKAVRPTQQNPQGGIVSKESAIHVSNVMLVCPSCGEAVRVSKRVNEAGKRVRVCRKCHKDIDK